MNKALGQVISGSLAEGFIMRIASNIDIETLKIGKFVSIHGNRNRYFSLITDIKLEVTHADILVFPPEEDEGLLKEALKTKDIYATAILRPMIMLDSNNKMMPVKTIPHHFADVHAAVKEEIETIFGSESDQNKCYFNVGKPLDTEAQVCINLDRLTERSSGIFGKTGTGKTFLTRLLLAGLIYRDKAVNIIFDMHNEYGLQARQEGNNSSFVKGLKTLFPDKVVIFSLDPESTRRRGSIPDAHLTINYNCISVEDIISLNAELNLSPTAYEAAYLIAAKYKKDWLEVLLSQADKLKEFAQEVGAHPESIASLYRKLRNIERLPFLKPSKGTYSVDMVDMMIEYVDRGISIIVEFGNYTSTFCYLLIANIITRRIHNLYTKKTEKFLGSHHKQDEPKKLIITIEEAHKFLNTQTAKQTIFGTIAREMRKYYVSLLVVDQRPSGIDPEVLSQIGTKIIAQLSDDKDIQAILSGSSGSTELKTILSGLESKKQVLILGHAISMPVVIESREYDEDFYKAMNPISSKKSIQQLMDEIF